MRRRPPRAVRSRVAVAVLAAAVGAAVMASCAGEQSATSRRSAPRPPATSPTTPTTAATPPAPAPAAAEVAFPEDWTPPRLDWQDCDDLPRGMECATLPVPLDWSRPDGDTVELALARRPADGDRIGSVVTNPGGPGGSGLGFLAADPFSPDVAERFDQVSWDPRGVGASVPISCEVGVDAFLELDADPDDPAEQVALDTAAARISTGCGAEYGQLLRHVATVDAAFDLEAIRRALGDEPLDYVGFSYGTQIGQTYAERFPTRIRTMVLDGVVDLSLSYTDFLIGQALAFEAAFDANADACAEAGASDCGVRDLAASFDRVKARAEQEPLPAGNQELGPSEVVVAATYVQYLEDGWTQLGPALAEAEDGDGTALQRLANRYYDLGGYTAYAAVVCTDNPPPSGVEAYRAFAEEARRVAPRFGGAVANELLPCATWPSGPTASPSPVVAEGAPPILVVGNTGDPATPYAGAVAVADQLASGVLLTVESDGHTAYGSDRCATDIIDRYLIDLEVPEDGTVCD